MKRQYRSILVGLACLAVVLAACSSTDDGEVADTEPADASSTDVTEPEPTADEAQGEDGSTEPISVTMGLAIPHPIFLTSMVGVESGIFADNGLDVELELFDGGPSATQALVAGEIDILEGGLSEILATYGTPNQLVAVTETVSNPAYAFYGREGIESWEDLEADGELVGVSAIGGLDYAVIRYALGELDIDPDSLDYQAVGTATARVSSLLGGTIDVTSSLAPGNYFIEADGLSQIGDLSEFIEQWPMEIYAVDQQTLEDRPEIAEALRAAVPEIGAWIAENQEETVDIVQSYLEFPEEQREDYARALGEFGPDVAPEEPSRQGMEIIVDFYLQEGVISGDPDDVLSEMFTY